MPPARGCWAASSFGFTPEFLPPRTRPVSKAVPTYNGDLNPSNSFLPELPGSPNRIHPALRFQDLFKYTR
ncbi:MAG: hypothetical protein N2110_09090 [Flavobacteriales bacterium]|nr:hypothetical protein [Flavobacteriales bacterium]